MKRLEKFTRSGIKHLKKLLKEYGASQAPNTLHSIRVEIKKIKAALQVTGSSRKKFKAHRAFLPFRDIFRRAGAIRDPEVLSKLLIKYKVNGVDSPPKKPKAGKMFLKDLPVFLEHIDNYKKKIIKAAGKIHKEDFRKYLSQMMNEVGHGVYPRVVEKDLHKTRKSAKSIIYLSSIEHSIEKDYRKFLGELENTVGNWHDKQTLIKLAGRHRDAKQKLQLLTKKDINSIRLSANRFFGKQTN